MGISLISGRAELEPYLDRVRRAGDSERDAFGFLPKAAYSEFADQGRMIVAADGESGELQGYVLYGGAMPQGKIFQTWTAEPSRGKGVGRKLISAVVHRLEKLHYLSIRADVAEDLHRANDFYDSLGFDTIMARPGRTPGRSINVRVRELATPSLLDIAGQGVSEVCLPIALPQAGGVPFYVLDLNVIFDIARARSKASSSGRVFAAGFENDARLAVTAELVAELERHATAGARDPILEFAASLPRLPHPPRKVHQALVAEIAPLVFDKRAQAEELTVQDKSDLTHLATAIVESATAFITSEKRILRAAEQLRERYRLEVLSPDAVGFTLDHEIQDRAIEVQAHGRGVRAHPLDERDYEDAEKFLLGRGLTPAQLRAVLASGTASHPRRRHIVRIDGAIAAIGTWDAPKASPTPRRLQVFVDETSAATSLASDYLLRRGISDVGTSRIGIFELVSKAGQPTLRQAALSKGFFGLQSSRAQMQTLQKVAAAEAVVPDGWSSFCAAVRARAGMDLPAQMPACFSATQTLEITNESGSSVSMEVAEFERLLSPLLLIVPGRASAIFPITQRYAEELFSGSAQPSLLAGREASLRSVRGYVSGRGTYSVAPEGSLVLFYESGTGGGRQAVTAIARVTRKYLMNKRSAAEALTEKAVLEAEAVESLGRGAQVVVTEFEDLMLLKNPVRLTRLRSLGCADGANFVTARPVSHEQVVEIVKAGQPYA